MGHTGQKFPEENCKWKTFKQTPILTKLEAELLAWVGPPQSNEAIPLEMPLYVQSLLLKQISHVVILCEYQSLLGKMN